MRQLLRTTLLIVLMAAPAIALSQEAWTSRLSELALFDALWGESPKSFPMSTYWGQVAEYGISEYSLSSDWKGLWEHLYADWVHATFKYDRLWRIDWSFSGHSADIMLLTITRAYGKPRIRVAEAALVYEWEYGNTLLSIVDTREIHIIGVDRIR